MRSYIETIDMLVDIMDLDYWDFHMKAGTVHTGMLVYLSIAYYPHGKLYSNLIDMSICTSDSCKVTLTLSDVIFIEKSRAALPEDARRYYMDSDMPTCSVPDITGREDLLKYFASIERERIDSNRG